MEEMDILLQAISTVGFPIAVAVWAMWQSRQDKEWLQNTLSHELNAITETLKEMSLTLERLGDNNGSSGVS